MFGDIFSSMFSMKSTEKDINGTEFLVISLLRSFGEDKFLYLGVPIGEPFPVPVQIYVVPKKEKNGIPDESGTGQTD